MAFTPRTDSQRADKPHLGKTSELLDRQPPRSHEAERGILGSMLLLPEVCDDVFPLIHADDFYDDAHRRIFVHLDEMHNSNRRIDITLLVERLKAKNELEMVGGMAYLASLVREVQNAAHATEYALLVREKSTLRQLIFASTEILRDAYDSNQEPKHLLSQAEQKIFSILENQGQGEVSSIYDILHQAMDRIDARMQGTHAASGILTGFKDLDTQTGGLHNSELIILAARPSMGKTALAMNIAEHVALNENQPVLFVSLEMSSLELGDRLLCSAARVNGHRLRNGTISKQDRQLLMETAGKLGESKLFVDDTPSRTMTEIAANARRLKRRHGLGLVVVDYLQLIEPDNPRDQRQEQVAKIARRLKIMARELKVPVICLAQLNRQAEMSRDNKPRLAHLRESGAIEQDADVVMFVHRDDYYASNDQERAELAGKAELIIAKQRNGPVGDVKLAWLKDFTRFENLAFERHEDFQDYGGGF
ncbi:MAG: replicative DNA helicase [Pirellulales bacterium]|nr:replicative DNA helicase [Pirellulales bacterium]